MPKGLTNRAVLDVVPAREVVLELLSFSGGENNIGEDHELELNEAREIKNWAVNSIGGMTRNKGFSEVGDGGGTYTEDVDLVAHHFEGTNTETYLVIEGDLVIKSGANLNQEDSAAFTSGTLCHAVSAANALWITNSTDNIKRKTIGNVIAAPSDLPPSARNRIYEHNFRLIAEGGGKDIYGSRAGTGNWTASDAWDAVNDAWSMTMPDTTHGSVPGFPSGTELTVFTEFDTYVVSNQPNVIRRRITNGIGSNNGHAVAKGNEGVFFVSTFPTLGIFLWDSITYVNLTEKNNFVDDIALANRMFMIYRDRKLYFFFNESGSGVSYPNRLRIYDTRFGRWHERPVNEDLSDNLGYPSLQTRDNNELYSGSSQKDKLYEVDDASTSDQSNNTEASYKTKCISSRDFNIASGGGRFPIDAVKIKLIKTTVWFEGTVGAFALAWNADRNLHVGSQTFDLTSESEDLINTTFTVNTSKIISGSKTKMATRSFNNSAIGKEFEFQVTNSGTGSRPTIKRIKISGIVVEEE